MKLHKESALESVLEALARHMESVAGIAPHWNPAPDAIQKLPAYFGSIYEAWAGDLFDHHYLFLVFKGQEPPTPAEIAGHYRVASRELGGYVAFVFPAMESFVRQRLVKYRVPFVVPCRQVFLPQFLIDLREGASGVRPAIGPIVFLSAPAQVFLLRYLQKPGLNSRKSLREWAALLGYSAMTATRFANELVKAQLCGVAQAGRKVLLEFDSDRHALWGKALPFLQSPVRERSHVHVMGGNSLPWRQAGLPALSRYSMLSDDGHVVLAASGPEYARAYDEGKIRESPFAEEDTVTVERWRYCPEALSDSSLVDRLSLYLSLQDNPDERVQAALKELLEGVQW